MASQGQQEVWVAASELEGLEFQPQPASCQHIPMLTKAKATQPAVGKGHGYPSLGCSDGVLGPHALGEQGGDSGLSSPSSQGQEPGLGAINSHREELLAAPTLLRMSQPALAWAGTRRSRRAGQRLEAQAKCGPVARETTAGRPSEWKGAGLSPRGTHVPGSPT